MLTVLDLIGVFFFAVSGSLMAVRRGFDLLGSIFLGGLCGLGGGVVRDLILNQPPATLQNPAYFLPPVLAALCVWAFTPAVQKLHRLVLLFDAGGLGLFCVMGSLKALQFGANPITATLLGVATGVGGGMLRDVVSNVTPELFNPRDIYALPAIVGAALTVTAWNLDQRSYAVTIAIACLTIVLRLASIRFGWSVPLAAGHWHRQKPAPDGNDGPQRHY